MCWPNVACEQSEYARAPSPVAARPPCILIGMSSGSTREVEVLRELMRLALRNSARNVPLQLAAVVVLVLFGLQAGRPVAAVATAALGIAVAVWRLRIASPFNLPDGFLSESDLSSAKRQLEGNSLLAG